MIKNRMARSEILFFMAFLLVLGMIFAATRSSGSVASVTGSAAAGGAGGGAECLQFSASVETAFKDVQNPAREVTGAGSKSVVGKTSKEIYSGVDSLTNRPTYVSGSVDAIYKQVMGGNGKPVTIAVFELADLTFVNSLAGHEAADFSGNVLIEKTSDAITKKMAALDPDAIVSRGASGSFIVTSNRITPEQLSKAIGEIQSDVTKSLPAPFANEGITGSLRMGTTTIAPKAGIARTDAKDLYYKGLQEAGAAAEYQKTSSGTFDFKQLTAGMSPTDATNFLDKYHNFIPPEAQTDSLFLVDDAKKKLDDARAALSKDPSNTALLKNVEDRANMLNEMAKRPARFESNANDAAKGTSIAIYDYQASLAKQTEIVGSGKTYFRADGDIDNARDLFKNLKVSSADEVYHSFYADAAQKLKGYENTHPGVQIWMEKGSGSDEFKIMASGVDAKQFGEILEITRGSFKSVGDAHPVNLVDKVTDQPLGRGTVSATMGTTYKPVTSASMIDTVANENDRIAGLRKYISGKNTVGSYDLTKDQAQSIMKTLGTYASSNNDKAWQEVKSVLNDKNYVNALTSNKKVDQSAIDTLLKDVNTKIKAAK